MPRWFGKAAVVLSFLLSLENAGATWQPPAHYLLASNAMNGTIYYAKVPTDGSTALSMKPLITSGLGHPQGLAVDQKRQLLFVADSFLGKIVSYALSVKNDVLLAGPQTFVAENVEPRWVAVDGMGNVYLTDEGSNQVLQVPARQILGGNTTATVMFPTSTESAATALISAPGGLATDNFYLYWANKYEGEQVGSVIRALSLSASNASLLKADPPQKLSFNVPKVFGVCMAYNTIYFTDDTQYVYAVPRTGGTPVTVTNTLINPRGCAWDGMSTVYVADRSAPGIFAFHTWTPGMSQNVALTQVSDMSEVFGLAMFSGARSLQGTLSLAFILLAAVLRR